MIRLTPATARDRDWVIGAHLAHYTAHEGFDARFSDAVADAFDIYLSKSHQRDTAGWIARQATDRVGSILCVPSPRSGCAQLRLFFVTDTARGQGVGTRLLRACGAFARAAGYRHLRLSTHAEHRAARALYHTHGFACLSSRPVHSFGRDLTEEVWSLPLANATGLQ